MPNSSCFCIDPKMKCHLGRARSDEAKKFCDKCISEWFDDHLLRRVEKMLDHKEAESKCIVMRSLIQFLGLRSDFDPINRTCSLAAAKEYFRTKLYPGRRKSPAVTFEVRAQNLGGEVFDECAVRGFKAKHPKEADLLARFHYGVHVHTAHLTWGANHSDKGVIWDINNGEENGKVVHLVCDLLNERLYKGRDLPWDEKYNLKIPRKMT